jgi:hypothetical protein
MQRRELRQVLESLDPQRYRDACFAGAIAMLAGTYYSTTRRLKLRLTCATADSARQFVSHDVSENCRVRIEGR